MGLTNCIEILESIVDNIKNATLTSDEGWADMPDEEILIHITAGLLGGAMGDDDTMRVIGREIACLCIALSKKNQSDAFMGVGALLCEIDKFFGAKDDEKTRKQIVSSMWCLTNGKRNKKIGLNIILGALLLAEPHGRTSEENNQTLLRIQKALAGVV